MVAALYRRYRPDAFSEMIGQSQVTEPLMTALRTGRIGHAYLFSGPRGCGKTTSARILARCLNCAEGPTDTPCGVCPSCIELSRDGGGSLDVVEIDAASHGGVDDARDLRERAVFAPARDRFKIFIIDEAHMVTPGGFNALLKIVEEPPPHVKFVFATTEPDKVIGTIRSRTHHYPFRLIAPGTLIDYVQSLCDSEGVQVEPGVLPLVVRAGGGSARDTLSILDQLIAGSEGDLVTAERAAGLLGFTHAELLDDVVAAFGAHDPAAAFRATDRVVQTGQDPRRFVEDLLERLRDLIVVNATTVDGAAAVFRGVPQDQLTRMFEQAQSFGPGEVSRIADVVSAALDKMAGATAPRLQLELMIARALVQGAAQLQQAAPVAAAQPSGAPQTQQQFGQQPGAQGSGQRPGAPAARPVAPQTPPEPKPDPLAALAAARSAATAPESPTSASHAAQTVPAPAQAPAPNAVPSSNAAPAPNAAQTAASIREFLNESDDAPVAPAVAAAPEQPPAALAPTPAATAPAPAPGAPASAPGNSDGDAPHPNEAAATFGRPISAVLSAAQIASIGSEPTAPPAASSAPTQPVAQPAAPAESPANRTSDTSVAQHPAESVPVPAAGSAESASAEPDAADTHDAESATSVAESGGYDDLLELWPDLLEEILERDRDAWNAVRVIAPLDLVDDVLTVGLASESDLAAFKMSGAGPLREAILSSVGISVKYQPKRMPAGAAPGAQGGAREPGSAADAEEPHRAGSTDLPNPPAAPSEPEADDPMARAAARLSGLGPALAAPAWADPQPGTPAQAAAVSAGPIPSAAEVMAESAVATTEANSESNSEPPASGDPAPPVATTHDPDASVASYADPADFGDPYADDAGEAPDDDEGDPYAAPRSAVSRPAAPRTAPEPSAASDGPAPAVPINDTTVPTSTAVGASSTAPSPAPASSPDAPKATKPAFTRYGEAVVREVLGARFVEERPLPPR